MYDGKLTTFDQFLGWVSDFKAYHFTIVNQLQNDEEEEPEQEVLDNEELKIMELIVRIEELIGEPSQT